MVSRRSSVNVHARACFIFSPMAAARDGQSIAGLPDFPGAASTIPEASDRVFDSSEIDRRSLSRHGALQGLRRTHAAARRSPLAAREQFHFIARPNARKISVP